MLILNRVEHFKCVFSGVYLIVFRDFILEGSFHWLVLRVHGPKNASAFSDLRPFALSVFEKAKPHPISVLLWSWSSEFSSMFPSFVVHVPGCFPPAKLLISHRSYTCPNFGVPETPSLIRMVYIGFVILLVLFFGGWVGGWEAG